MIAPPPAGEGVAAGTVYVNVVAVGTLVITKEPL